MAAALIREILSQSMILVCWPPILRKVVDQGAAQEARLQVLGGIHIAIVDLLLSLSEQPSGIADLVQNSTERGVVAVLVRHQ